MNNPWVLTSFKNKFGRPDKDGTLECINPIIDLNRKNPNSTMKYPSIRYSDNCRKCNFLIEFDPYIPPGISEEDKAELISNHLLFVQDHKLSELIKNKSIVRAVFSGSKSIHFLVSVKDEPKTNNEYRFCFNKIVKKLNCTGCDRACKDCSRMTRKPNAIREDNGQIQKLLYEDRSNVLDLDWREDYEIYKRDKERKAEELRQRLDNVTDWQDFIRNYLRKHPEIGEYIPGNRNQFVVSLVGAMKIAGCDDIRSHLSIYGVDEEILEETKNLWRTN